MEGGTERKKEESKVRGEDTEKSECSERDDVLAEGKKRITVQYVQYSRSINVFKRSFQLVGSQMIINTFLFVNAKYLDQVKLPRKLKVDPVGLKIKR